MNTNNWLYKWAAAKLTVTLRVKKKWAAANVRPEDRP